MNRSGGEIDKGSDNVQKRKEDDKLNLGKSSDIHNEWKERKGKER